MNDDNENNGKVMMGEEDRAENQMRDANRKAKKGKGKVSNNATYIKKIVSIVAIILLFVYIFSAQGVGVIVKGSQKNKIKNSIETIYEMLEVDDLVNFVEIKGDDDSGFYLEFIDDADEKLKDVVKELKQKYNLKNVDVNLLKRMIKAEVVTQYPFLRGAGKISGSTSYEGNTVAEKVWNFLISKGYSEIAVAGAMGNIHQESGGFNTGIVENGGTGEGIGLIQWSHGRRDQLEKYAQAMGKPWSDLELQLDFLYMELTGEAASDGNTYANVQFMFGKQPVWENATSIEEATIAFEEGFERAGTPMMDNRIKWANIYYEKYKGTYTPGSTQNSGEQTRNNLEGMLFIGDSITHGLSMYGGISDQGVQFRGRDNTNPQDWLNNYNSWLPEDSDDISALSVMLGTNELSQTSQMMQLLEKLHERYPNKMIYVQKILPNASYAQQVDSYNNTIENYCTQHSAYLTFNDSTAGVELSSDGVHPTQEGYKTLASNMTGQVQESGEIVNAKGFQGTIRIRRVTPNKNIGEVKNTGKGNTTTTSNTTDNSGIGAYITNSATSGIWSVYAKNLTTNQEKVNINNRKMKSASVIKLFIMATAFGEISEGRMQKSDVIDDIRIMINVSDNAATNRLIDKLGFSRINSFIQGFGCTATEINRKMEEQATHGDNYTSVRDVGKLLEAIYRGTCISQEASNEMLEILKTQTRRNKIPAGVPSGVQVANKTGELYEGSKVENDAAIVFKENSPYILVVMSNDVSDNDAAVNNIKEISSKVYNTINSSSSSEGGTNSNAAHKVAIVAGHGSTNHSGTYEEIANRTKWYTRGTSGVTPSGETWSEFRITKKVADYVEKALSGYGDISVVQVGYSQPNWERMQLAKNQGVDAYVGIHFNSSSDTSQNGVYAYYRNGDNTSKNFANIFADTVSQAMGLKNNGVQNDSTTNNGILDSIGNASEWGFPSTIVEGGFMSNSSDMATIGADNEEGLKKYAQGIANGVLQYYGIENTGTDGINTVSSTTDKSLSVESKIYDLKYVSPQKFNEYVESNNRQALNVYTLDEETKKLIVANWSFTTEEGIKISASRPINYRSVINKYTMPIEFLLAFLVHSDDKELVSNLADIALDSEFIIAVQDNVTTVQTTVNNQEKNYREYIMLDPGGSYLEYGNFVDWHTVETTIKVQETVSNDIELTYADAWFVKFFKESSYSTISFDADASNDLTADQGELIGNYKITTYCSACSSNDTASGKIAKANHTIAVHESDYNGSGSLSKGKQVVINGQVYTVEDIGDTNNIQPNNWIDIFIESQNGQCSCNSSSLNSNNTPVYVAQNVAKIESNAEEGSNSNNSENGAESEIPEITVSEAELRNKNLKGLNTVERVNGTITDTTTVTEEMLDTIRNEVPNYAMQTDVTERKRITTIRTISNKYDSGIEKTEDNSQKFIDVFLQSSCRYQFNIEWMSEFLQQSEKTVNMIELTTYLYKKAMEQARGQMDSSYTYNFDAYKVNDFSKIYRSQGILEEYIKALENNALRLYMNNHISYDEGIEGDEIELIYSVEGLEKYVTLNNEEPKYKIFSNNVGGWGYAYNIFHRLNETEWNSGGNIEKRVVEHYQDLGIDITTHVNEGMEIDVDIVDQVMRAEIEKWKEVVEESLENNNVELEDYQKEALIAIAYKYGWSEQDTQSFKDAYEKYYENNSKEEFRQKFSIAQNTENPFKLKDELENYEVIRENRKIDLLWHLFDTGEYKTLNGEILDKDSFSGYGSSELLGVAEEIWKNVCQSYTTYGALGNIPPSNSQTQVDCSGYVSWVLYQYGINTRNDALAQEFQSWQHTTTTLKSVNWESLGFEVIPVAAGQDVRNILQPGDILDRCTGDGAKGHVNICVEVTENGTVLTYDCGSASHWLGKNGAPYESKGFASTDSRPGIIIRKK